MTNAETWFSSRVPAGKGEGVCVAFVVDIIAWRATH